MSGLFVIQLEAFSLKKIKLVFLKLKGAATIYALLASLTAAGYTLWDKYSVAHVHPFVYFYAYSGIVGISYALFIAVKYPFSDIKTEFLTRKYSLLQVACFNTFSYLMILFSLQTGKARLTRLSKSEALKKTYR